MFDIISKQDYWSYIDGGFVSSSVRNLKNIQDGFLLSSLSSISDSKVLEVGGGHSRVLASLSLARNECWNADKLEGVGNGPTRLQEDVPFRVVSTLLGEFDQRLPNEYFDVVFSVSVLEHVPLDGLDGAFADMARVMAPGGRMVHAIDLYVGTEEVDPALRRPGQRRISAYLKAAVDAGLELVEKAAISSEIGFGSSMASNSDECLYDWNAVAPRILEMRRNTMSVSIKAEWRKPPLPQ